MVGDNHFTNNLNGVVNRGDGTSVLRNRFFSTPDFISSQGITYGTQGLSSAGKFATDAGPSDVIIANNDFRGLYGAGIEVGESTTTTIAGNTLESNGAGIEVTHVFHSPSNTLVYRNRVVGNQVGLALGGGKADADIVANMLTQNSMVDLSIDTDAVVNAAKCNAFDNLPPVVGVVGDTGCPVGGDICYTVGTPEPVLPSGLCAIVSIP
jgi:parallel beta-helix repeat protein